jgi:hypothetical protein
MPENGELYFFLMDDQNSLSVRCMFDYHGLIGHHQKRPLRMLNARHWPVNQIGFVVLISILITFRNIISVPFWRYRNCDWGTCQASEIFGRHKSSKKVRGKLYWKITRRLEPLFASLCFNVLIMAPENLILKDVT